MLFFWINFDLTRFDDAIEKPFTSNSKEAKLLIELNKDKNLVE